MRSDDNKVVGLMLSEDEIIRKRQKLVAQNNNKENHREDQDLRQKIDEDG